MPTQAEIRQHQEVVAGLALFAQRDLAELLTALDLEDVRRAAAIVREFFPELAATYTLAASAVAADWYDDLRAEAAVAAAFTATTLDAPDTDGLQAAVGFALAPLFTEEQPLTIDATSRLSNLAETVVTSADRQTIRANAATDRAKPVYARHASANACAFCALLATRGATYATEESASRVVLGRGSRKLGEKYHDNCRCVAVPTWNPAGYEEAPYVEQWRDAYTAATSDLGGANDTKAILAHMRESLGSH